jgi:hypothetical protein
MIEPDWLWQDARCLGKRHRVFGSAALEGVPKTDRWQLPEAPQGTLAARIAPRSCRNPKHGSKRLLEGARSEISTSIRIGRDVLIVDKPEHGDNPLQHQSRISEPERS